MKREAGCGDSCNIYEAELLLSKELLMISVVIFIQKSETKVFFSVCTFDPQNMTIMGTNDKENNAFLTFEPLDTI